MNSDEQKPQPAKNSKQRQRVAHESLRPLRIWPVVLLLFAMLGLRVITRFVTDPSDTLLMLSMMGPAACAILILLWWLAFSRSAWKERWMGGLGVAAVLLVTGLLNDASLMPIGLIFLTIPIGLAMFGLACVLLGRMTTMKRTLIAVLMAAIGCGYSTLLRMDGMWSNSKMTYEWRWISTSEAELVASRAGIQNTEVSLTPEITASLLNPEWPSFRGTDRTGRQRGTVLASQWGTKPKLVWKVPAGPSWSSFAVAGNLLFTQEQRGKDESVVCYAADTGEEIWICQVEERFEESVGGPGPRATPTLASLKSADGQLIPALFAYGATGILLRIDPATGEKVWSKDLQEVSGSEPPGWGFCSSPLVVDSKVIVHAGGDKGLLAFDVASGDLVWSAKSGDHSYASAQLSRLLGEDVVLMLTNDGLEIVNPADGSTRLNYDWVFKGYRVLQPFVVNHDSIIVPSGIGAGTRMIRVAKSSEDEWSATDVWTSRFLKPDFNDFVVYQNNIYGFDGSIFTCIDLETGKRQWKGGRYGKGQVLLLEDSGLLLVAAESGEVVLLKADPGEHVELGTFQALDGKTWNHPVVVGNRLYLRNAKEAACFELPE